MRMSRPGAAWPIVALAALTVLAPTLHAQQAERYTPTLHFGTGLINSPVAWVSPENGTIYITSSAKEILSVPDPSEMRFSTRWNTNLALETHWLGRFTVGVAAHSQNPEWGFFGRALLLRDNALGFLPAVAVGVRNLGPYQHEERFLIGHDIRLDGDQYEEFSPEYFQGFSTAPSFFAVATKDFILARRAGFPSVSLGFNLGWGDGLFREDGGLGDAYNESGTIAPGLFLGSRVVTHPTANTTVTLLAENDGFDWNAGLVGDWRGITLGVYGTELESGSDRKPESFLIYNYRKWNVAFGYNGNIFDIARGVILRTRITHLELERNRLRLEIAERGRRISGLELALRRAQAGELADLARRREEMERAVQEEREAIRRAEERLRQIQEGRDPVIPAPTPPPGGSTPPSP